jgi:hypothetical protein
MAKIIWNEREFLREVHRVSDRAVEDAAVGMVKDIKASFTSSSPSPPNDEPAIASGELQRGIEQERGDRPGVRKVGVEAAQDIKGLSLELGSKDRAPRPFLRNKLKPTIKKLAKTLTRKFNR